MRWKAFLLAIPTAASALSLANFQPITSRFIPLSCQVAYDSQIPICTGSDFRSGCSSGCQDSLQSVARTVSLACLITPADPKSLLATIRNGQIIEALCPATTQETTSAVRATSTPDLTPTEQSPTNIALTIVSTTSKPHTRPSPGTTSTKTTATTSSVHTSVSSTKSSSSSTTSKSRTTAGPTTDSSDSEAGPTDATSTDADSPTGTEASEPDDRLGGQAGLIGEHGGLFGIQTSDAAHISRSALLVLIVAAAAGALLGRSLPGL